MFKTTLEWLTKETLEVLFLVRRAGVHPPRLMRKHLRHFALRRISDSRTVDAWDKTLIGGFPLAPTISEEAGEVRDSSSEVFRQSPRVRTPRMRCLIVTGIFDVGGTDEVVAFLGRRLPEHDIDVVVAHTGTSIADTAGGRLPSLLRNEGIKVEDVTEASAHKLLIEFCPDVISAHGAPSWWLELAKSHNVPYVETLHGMHSFYDIDWKQEVDRSAHVDMFIAVSELVRQQYIAGNTALDPARVVTVPNSVDPHRLPHIRREAAREWLNLEDEFLFVSLARHTSQKNTYGLVRAFAEVADLHPNAHLLISGRADDALYARQVRKLCETLHCRDRIHLREHSPWPERLLAAADGFVLNSYFEGWSLASMEALYAGIAVILSDVGGAREQVGGAGERGYLVGNPLGDPLRVNWETIRASLYAIQPNQAELVSAMCRMISDRERWNQKREWLRSDSAARFHPNYSLSGHAEVLRSVVANASLSDAPMLKSGSAL